MENMFDADAVLFMARVRRIAASRRQAQRMKTA
jgi:hypothetical protein